MTTDPSFFERSVARLEHQRGNEDRARFWMGLRLARLDTKFGAGTIERAGREAHIKRSSAFSYAKVSCFLVRWLGHGAKRFYDDHPVLAYSHVRSAVEAFKDIELIIEALECAETELMTPDQFAVWLSQQKGRQVPSEALFDMSGNALQVFENLRKMLFKFHNKRIRIIIREE